MTTDAMSSPTWQPQGSCALLHGGAISAALDVAQPSAGLALRHTAQAGIDSLRLFALGLPRVGPGGEAEPPAEWYIRGSDLVAVYPESDVCPMEVDALWRACCPNAPDPRLAIVDLILSVRTNLACARAALTVASSVPGAEVFRLIDAGNAAYSQVNLRPDATVHLDWAVRPSCLYFPLPAAGYVEMVHPSSVCTDELVACDRGGQVHLCHRLFGQGLEKGVLLRAWIRGVLLAGAEQKRCAADCYAEFASVSAIAP